MSASAMSPVQAAVYAILAADATLAALTEHVGDSIPEGSNYATAVLITPILELPDRTFGVRGHEVQVQVECLAEDRAGRTGNLTLQQMTDRVVDLLDGAALTVTGHATVLCHLMQTTTVPATDYRRTVTDFQILVEDAA